MNNDLIGVIVAAVILLANQFLTYLRRKYLNDPIYNEIGEMKNEIGIVLSEVKPNGGKSIADKINIIDANLNSLKELNEKQWGISLDNAPTAIFLNDKYGKFIYVNQKLCDMFMMSKDDMLFDGWTKKIRHPDVHYRIWLNCVEKGIPYRDQYTLIGEKGENVKTIMASAEPIHTDRGEILFFYGKCVDTSVPIKET